MIEEVIEKFIKNFDRVLICDSMTRSSLTYGEVFKSAVRIANQLNLQNIGKGARIGIILNNSVEIIAAYFAVLFTGAIVVPLNPNYSRSDIEYSINKTKLDAIISIAEHFDKLNTIFFKKKFLEIDVSEVLLNTIEDVKINFQLPDVRKNDVIGILFTSGTTGYQKGVMMKYGPVFESLKQYGHDMGFNHETRFIQVVPFFHAHGWFYSTIVPVLFEASVIITESFNIVVCSKFWDLANKYNANVLVCVPSILTSLLEMKDRYIDMLKKTLDYVICGSAFLSPELKVNFENTFNTTIYEFYGSTETLYIAYHAPTVKYKVGTVGKLFPTGCEIKVAEDGELLVKTRYAFKGYFDEAKLTKEAMQDGWIKSGDLGFVDESGYVLLTGRKKDIINKGGYKVSPVKISNSLMESDLVHEAATIGIKDPMYGEEICSFIVLKDKGKITEHELLMYFRQKLNKMICPKRIILLEEIPKNSTGKVDKFELIRIADNS